STLEPDVLLSAPAAGIVSFQSSVTASAVEVLGERGPAMAFERTVEHPHRPSDACSIGDERTPVRSIGLSIVLAVAVISPNALGRWLGSIANRRRARWTNKTQQ